jgi:hypothetical protein
MARYVDKVDCALLLNEQEREVLIQTLHARYYAADETGSEKNVLYNVLYALGVRPEFIAGRPHPYQPVRLLDGNNDLLCPECRNPTVTLHVDQPIPSHAHKTEFEGHCTKCKVKLTLHVAAGGENQSRSFLEWLVWRP